MLKDPFEAILAQPAAVRVLRRAIETDRVASSYLFEGPSGVGKEKAAMALATILTEAHGDEVLARGPDAVCHDFWGDRTEAEATGIPGLFGDTIDAYFRETDRMLGEILEEIDLRRTTVLVVSDHGFQGPRTGLDGSQRFGIYMHRELGTVLVAGPWAAGAGLRVEGARVQDILPTLLKAHR